MKSIEKLDVETFIVKGMVRDLEEEILIKKIVRKVDELVDRVNELGEED